jgi:hypothetical protein
LQIKTTLRFYLSPVRRASRTQVTANVGEDVGKKETSYTVGGNVKYYNHYGKQYSGSLKN